MSCKPSDLLSLAQNLHKQKYDEAMARTIVSRAYYAALHEVQVTFPSRGVQFRVDGESTHAEVISRAATYGKQAAPGRGSAAVIAKAITRLRRSRNFADYKIEESFDSVDLEDELKRAEQIFSLCSDVLEKMQKACAS